ncbi:MAG: hypothetical protein ACK4ND_15480, partial [Cytophagaceae bacterium]
NSKKLKYITKFEDCVNLIGQEKIQMAVVVGSLTFPEITKICLSGYTLPQKSTFFYPKPMNGFVCRELDD